MPRRKFDKKNATTFQLVHRAQNDPLIHDDNAPSMVFAEKQQPRRNTEDDYPASSSASAVSGASYRSRKTKDRGDLEEEFGLSFKQNEGQAAQHGVFYDDTQYDYMQHMRDLGSGSGAVTWVESNGPAEKKGKGKQRLEDALRDLDLETGSVGASSMASSAARSLLPEEVLPSEFVRKRTYQDQQDVPDEIAGFQPDMDPNLRQAMEALDDEEFVEDDEDLFGELIADGFEVEKEEWERLSEQQLFEDDEDGGYASDGSNVTIKAPASPSAAVGATADLQLPEDGIAAPPEDTQAQPPADPTSGAWLDEFKKFKSAEKSAAAPNDGPQDHPVRAPPSALDASLISSLATGGRKKKRKGALTSTTNYSMTSSALARTDQYTLLDDRFDKMEEAYTLAEFPEDEEFDESASAMSGMTGMSKASKMSRYSAASGASGMSGMSGVSSYSRFSDAEAPNLVRTDFDEIMDDFLGGYGKVGKTGRRVKRGANQSGMQQLDEIRSVLGPARVNSQATAK